MSRRRAAGVLLTARQRARIRVLARRHGAEKVRLFGSAARGEASCESDFDLLVRMRSGRSLLDFVALWQELETALGRHVDLVSEAGLSPYLRAGILKEARPL